MSTRNAYVPAGASAVLEDTVVEARMPWSGRVARGEHLVLVDLEGQQAIDFLCFNADRPRGALPRAEHDEAPGQHLPRRGVGAVVGAGPGR